MNQWIICYKKEDATLPAEVAGRVQINRDSVKYVSVYDDKVEFDFTDRSSRVFYFSDWDVRF